MVTEKQILHYIPYQLQVEHPLGIFNVTAFQTNEFKILLENDEDILWVPSYDFGMIKPLLRDLEELNIEIEHEGEHFTPLFVLVNMRTKPSNTFPREKAFNALRKDIMSKNLPFDMMNKVLEWKFDIDGLLENGLAKRL